MDMDVATVLLRCKKCNGRTRTVSRTMTSSAEAETSSDPLSVLALLLESESLLSSCSFGIVDRKERLDQITSG